MYVYSFYTEEITADNSKKDCMEYMLNRNYDISTVNALETSRSPSVKNAINSKYYHPLKRTYADTYRIFVLHPPENMEIMS